MQRLFLFLTLAVELSNCQDRSGGSPARSGGLLVVANQREHTLLVVDPNTKRELSKTIVGVNGHEVAVSKDGRLAYVPIYGDSDVGHPGTGGNSIDIVDLSTGRLVNSIELDKPVRPHVAVFGSDSLLYVTAELADAVEVVDPTTRKVVGEISTGQSQSHALTLSPDGRHAYVANVGPGSVSVLDLENRRLAAIIPVAKRIQRISISTDGRRVFTHDRETPRIAVIDTASNKVSDWVELPESPFASTPTPDGHWLVVATFTGKRLYVVDLDSLKIFKSFDIPELATEILMRPDGGKAYISCARAGQIAVLDLKSWQLEEPITLSRGVDGLAWAVR